MCCYWDEAPAHVRAKNSFFFHIIKAPHLTGLERATVVVSSRPSASGALRQFVSSRVEVLGFTGKRIEEYVMEAISNPEAARELLTQVKDVPQLGQNCHLPLNLVIITHIFLCMGHKLPSTYCRIIIALALNCLLRHIQKTTSLSVESLESFSDLPDTIAHDFHALCKLAYKKTVEERYTFRQYELASTFKNNSTHVPTLGLLQAVHSLIATGSPTVYHFLHLSLQELCTAYHIASLHTTAKQISALSNLKEGTRNNPRFNHVCLFYSALTSLKHQEMVEWLTRMYNNTDHCYVKELEYGRVDPRLFECLLEAQNSVLSLESLEIRYGLSLSDEKGQAIYSYFDQNLLIRTVERIAIDTLVFQGNLHDSSEVEQMKSIVECISTTNARVRHLSLTILGEDIRDESIRVFTNKTVITDLSKNRTLKKLSLTMWCQSYEDGLLQKLSQDVQENELLTSIDIFNYEYVDSPHLKVKVTITQSSIIKDEFICKRSN